MGRPPSIVEDYHEWQRRLERHQSSEASLDVFCLQEGISRSTFFRWKRRLNNGIPETLQADSVEPEQNGSLAGHIAEPAECSTGGQRPWIELTLTPFLALLRSGRHGCRVELQGRSRSVTS